MMKTNATSNSKRIIMAAVGRLLLIGLLTAGISTVGNRINFTRAVQAQEETKSDPTDLHKRFRCSNETLAGRYAVIGDGFVPSGPPPAPLVPFGLVSLMTMDGAGNLSNKVTVSRNGQISQNLDPGTYSVNADCTGTMTISPPSLPFQLTFDLVVADLQGARQGKEFYFIATSGGVVTHTAKRIQ